MNPVISNLSQSPQGSTVQIQDNYYNFNVVLLNSDGNSITIRHGAIKDLCFTEDMRFFYNYGYIVFDNQFNAMESAESISTGVDGAPEKAFTPFVFRNDGRDLIAINIVPQIQYEDADVGETTSKDKKSFALNGLFSIFDSEEILTEDKNEKFTKLYFRDYAYQLLKEKDSYFSTGKIKKGTSNTDRSIPSGEALRAVIQQALSDDTKLNQGFQSNWDVGSEKIFYSSPPNNKAIDDINYLLGFHVSGQENNFSPSILRHNRDGSWTFTPLKTIQDGSYYKGTSDFGDFGGPGTVENFIIARPTAGSSDTPGGMPGRTPGFSPFANSFSDYSYAENFQHSSMTADDVQSGMVTTVGHHYDSGAGQFVMDMERTNIGAITKDSSAMFVQNQKGITGKSPASNLTLNLTRSENKNIKHEYSVSNNPNLRLNVSRNKALMLQFFNNHTVSFRARGKTDRTVGKFITLNRNDGANDNTFDNEMLGSYCLVKVEHSFVNNQYINDIIAVKNYNAAESTSSNKAV